MAANPDALVEKELFEPGCRLPYLEATGAATAAATRGPYALRRRIEGHDILSQRAR